MAESTEADSYLIRRLSSRFIPRTTQALSLITRTIIDVALGRTSLPEHLYRYIPLVKVLVAAELATYGYKAWRANQESRTKIELAVFLIVRFVHNQPDYDEIRVDEDQRVLFDRLKVEVKKLKESNSTNQLERRGIMKMLKRKLMQDELPPAKRQRAGYQKGLYRGVAVGPIQFFEASGEGTDDEHDSDLMTEVAKLISVTDTDDIPTTPTDGSFESTDSERRKRKENRERGGAPASKNPPREPGSRRQGVSTGKRRLSYENTNVNTESQDQGSAQQHSKFPIKGYKARKKGIGFLFSDEEESSPDEGYRPRREGTGFRYHDEEEYSSPVEGHPASREGYVDAGPGSTNADGNTEDENTTKENADNTEIGGKNEHEDEDADEGANTDNGEDSDDGEDHEHITGDESEEEDDADDEEDEDDSNESDSDNEIGGDGGDEEQEEESEEEQQEEEVKDGEDNRESGEIEHEEKINDDELRYKHLDSEWSSEEEEEEEEEVISSSSSDDNSFSSDSSSLSYHFLSVPLPSDDSEDGDYEQPSLQGRHTSQESRRSESQYASALENPRHSPEMDRLSLVERAMQAAWDPYLLGNRDHVQEIIRSRQQNPELAARYPASAAVSNRNPTEYSLSLTERVTSARNATLQPSGRGAHSALRAPLADLHRPHRKGSQVVRGRHRLGVSQAEGDCPITNGHTIGTI